MPREVAIEVLGPSLVVREVIVKPKGFLTRLVWPFLNLTVGLRG